MALTWNELVEIYTTDFALDVLFDDDVATMLGMNVFSEDGSIRFVLVRDNQLDQVVLPC